MTLSGTWYANMEPKEHWYINVHETRRGYIPCNSQEECDRIFNELHDSTNPQRSKHIDRIIFPSQSIDQTFGPRAKGEHPHFNSNL